MSSHFLIRVLALVIIGIGGFASQATAADEEPWSCQAGGIGIASCEYSAGITKCSVSCDLSTHYACCGNKLFVARCICKGKSGIGPV